MSRGLSRLLCICLLLLPLTAFAQWATITSSVNMRAGPGREFPIVTWLRQGQRVNVVGCMAGRPWCDVAWGRRRGWVHRTYLGGMPRGRIPTVTFSVGRYWDAHYRSSPWYSSRSAWAGWGSPSFRPPPPPPRRW